MSIAALALALSLVTPPDTTPLTFVHGDEGLVTWIDRAALRRDGRRVRLLALRIRHPDQAFWTMQEIDCDAETWAPLGSKTVTARDDAPPPMGEQIVRPNPIRPDDSAQVALRNAACDGIFVEADIAAAAGATAAIARLNETRAAAIRARPLQLIVIRGGASPVFMDRATLESGGPQVEVRSLEMTQGRGVWSGWMLDCERRDLAMDLQWSAPMVGDGYGTVTRDRNFDGREPADAMETTLNRTACDPGVWSRPVHASIDAATRAAGANPR